MYSQEIEIIEEIKSFHKHLSEFYTKLAKKSENQRVKMLLDYLSHNEKLREEFLIKYEDFTPKSNMKNWIRKPTNSLSTKISECSKKIKILPSYSVDDVFKTALHFNECLVKLYKSLAIEEEFDRSFTKIFHYMLKRTKQQEMKLSRDVNLLYDF
ncbi:MAG: hypothetical protein JXR51_06135 [Bacteroidales bacterium]|nr:hypothetical protein [Bacteroidales bacterium]MBN2756740.1 hypothetical protein [Bacteroidales bacterium]